MGEIMQKLEKEVMINVALRTTHFGPILDEAKLTISKLEMLIQMAPNPESSDTEAVIKFMQLMTKTLDEGVLNIEQKVLAYWNKTKSEVEFKL